MTANFTNTIGASELETVWTAPNFDPNRKAFYFARVIEIPTPGWSTIEAFRFGIPIPEGAGLDTRARLHLADLVHAVRLKMASGRTRSNQYKE